MEEDKYPIIEDFSETLKLVTRIPPQYQGVIMGERFWPSRVSADLLTGEILGSRIPEFNGRKSLHFCRKYIIGLISLL